MPLSEFEASVVYKSDLQDSQGLQRNLVSERNKIKQKSQERWHWGGKPARFTGQVPGHPGLQRNPVSQKTKQNKNSLNK